MGQSYVAPPGVSAPILEALRRAFDATMKDPDFIAELKRGGSEFNPIDGVELSSIVAKTISVPQQIIARYQAAIAEQ